jgi:RNA polymerase sigma-70 factor, ECF subfamily
MQLVEHSAALPRTGEDELVAGLRRGDASAFAELVDAYTPALTAVAMRYVGSRAVAEEVVQEAWLRLLRGIDDFEQRSSLKTWLFGILTNVARWRARHERRSVPFSCVEASGGDEPETTVDPERFVNLAGHRWYGGWSAAPADWDGIPEDRLLAGETLDTVKRAIETLPERQRQVIALRDIQGWSADDVCATLELSEANQRVLLHRARAKVRAAIEQELEAAVV